ncbi:MAG: 30S ribosomal protein S2 [Thermodesulfobacteriota bacterium]
MAYLTMKQLLESGVHFGHQTRRWNPKMKSYIFGARNGIYIIDLQQTVKLFRSSYDFVRDSTARGARVLFVGTKKQAHKSIEEEARRCGMFYVNNRWIGGFLTNFATVKKSIARLNKLDKLEDSEDFAGATKKERLMLEREKLRLEKYLGGVREMTAPPAVMFVVDSKKEAIAIKEARKLGITVVAIVDSNCDPDEVDMVIPGNDDAIRAIKLFSSAIADACLEGTAMYEASLQSKSEEEAKAAPAGAAEPAGDSSGEIEKSGESSVAVQEEKAVAPVEKSEAPAARTEKPVKEAAAPAEEAKEPAKKAAAPAKKAEKPAKKAAAPAKKAEEPAS